MAENPHNLEKDIKGTFNAFDLTGKAEGGIVDRIVQLKHELPTGNSRNLYAYDMMIKAFYKQLDDLGLTGFQTDEIDANFTPSTITGFFDNVVNETLFDFFGKGNDGFHYSLRKINPDYTGYACKIYRELDNAVASVEFDSDGIVSTGSKAVIDDGDRAFALSFKGTGSFATDSNGKTGTLFDFMSPIGSTAFDRAHDCYLEKLLPQRSDTGNYDGNGIRPLKSFYRI